MKDHIALHRSRLMMVTAMTIFGTIALFVRKIPLSSSEIALCRAVMAALLLGSYFLLSGRKTGLRDLGRELPLLILSGMAVGFNWILLFEAYRYTTVSVATLSYYFAPVIITVACPILFKEKMGAKQWLCFIMSTIGIVLVTGIGDLNGGDSHLRGIFFGLSAAVLYATAVLLNKYIKGVAGIQRTFLQFVAASVVLLPYVLLTGGFHLQDLSPGGWRNLLFVGIVHTGLSYTLYFSALGDMPGQEAAILSYIDPLVAVGVSVFALGENLSAQQLIGGILILGFTLLSEIKQKKGNEET